MLIKNKITQFYVSSHSDDRGDLTVITEKLTNFDIKRVYYVVVPKKNTTRGGHAHSTISQVIYVIRGGLKIVPYGNKIDIVNLEKNCGLIIYPLTWVSIESLEDDTIYIVLANGPYDKNEYINNIERLEVMINNGS